MNGFALSFLLITVAVLFSVQRRWAPLPLLAGACYMTLGQGIEIGPLHFPIIRLLLLAGFIRVLVRGERLSGKLNALDKIMIAWGLWALFSSVFVQPLIGQLGMVYNTWGIYFLIRVYCQTYEDIVLVVKIIALFLFPVALEMSYEQFTGHNLFAALGGVTEMALIRGDRIRAQGPFSHSILAGTVGAAVLPLMIGIWNTHRSVAKIGLVSCSIMVIASSSSGPILSALFGVFALILWRWRHLTHKMRMAALGGYILLDLVMKAPAYYLIARIDLTGNSTGDHRAALIQAAIDHFNEWWLAGTLYTRHWMAYGVTWSPDHCDITNQYIGYGVFGGFALMVLFIAALWKSFQYVGRFLQMQKDRSSIESKFAWALGSALFAQAASCISVFYFDQSFIFLYLNIAIIGSLYSYGIQQQKQLTAPVTFVASKIHPKPDSA